LSDVETFRIANIGHMDSGDIRGLLRAIAVVKEELGTW
jgi:aspartate aminotransferase-like enzyme